jgi:hypothetical protein
MKGTRTMNAVRQLAQAVLVLGLLGCVIRLLPATTSNTTDQHQEVGCDTEPIWVRDQQGGRVLPGGDVGGDRQASESFSVRFHHRDHPGVLVTYSYYAAVDEENLAAITVDRETEFMVCTDPADPGGSEVWSAYRWTALQGGFGTVQAATDAALQAAQAHLVCEEPWAGRPPWSPEQEEGPR